MYIQYGLKFQTSPTNRINALSNYRDTLRDVQTLPNYVYVRFALLKVNYSNSTTSRNSAFSSVTVFRFLHVTSLRPLKSRTIDLKLIIKMPHPNIFWST